ncbi:MAG: LysR family transcriptional regulator, partial [Alphaproteobacteria bacterium]|nr:LysR family transcriptional regulator [Alphaproteobacteria bacterium]
AGRVVRVSAGAWVSHRLARQIADVRPPGTDWLLELVTDDARRDIARREVDIGIRNRRPEEPWLAGRRLGAVAFAAYGRAGDAPVAADTPAAALTDRPWIGRTEREASTPSAAWIDRHHAARVVLRSNAPRILLDLVEAGAGVTVLPTFVGDGAPGLVRLGAPIDELVHDQWLVAHHEGRHDPPVRAAIDRLVAVLGGG